MSTLESRTWDAQQDRISDDQLARKVSEAIASPQAVVDSLLAALETGNITNVSAVSGGIEFEHDGIPAEIVFDSLAGRHIAATLWIDDEHEDPVEVASLRVTVDVIA